MKKNRGNRSPIDFDAPSGTATLPDHQILTIMEQPKQKPIETIERTFQSSKFKFWGDDNSYPQDVIAACASNTIIPSTIAWKANQIASGNLRPGYFKFDETDGSEIFIPINVSKYPEIYAFIRNNNLQQFTQEILRDLYWWNMAFADYGLDAERKKIVSLVAQDMTECRFGLQNPKTGLKDTVFINANWPLQGADYISEEACLDPYYDVIGQITNGSKYRYIYPLFMSIPGRKYYQDSPWHSIINSQWLDVANKIPKVKNKIMDNQMHFKYIIYIPMSWWKAKFKGWEQKTQDQQDALQKTVIENFNQVLSGVEGAGKSIICSFDDLQQGREYAKWEIKEMVSKIDSNTYIEDSQEASSHILYAINVDGTLIGNSPGKSMGAGSGSDKRVAYNIFILSNKIYQNTCCGALDKISQFNGWKTTDDSDIVWQFKNELISTQDLQKPQNRI